MTTILNVLKKLTSFLFLFLGIIALLIVLPMIFSIKPYVVLSGSMEPSIPTGALVFVDTKFPVDLLKPSDIIAFHLDDNTVVTHRIQDKTSTGFVTKGDANSTADWNEVPISKVIGKSIFAVPKLGFFLSLTRTIGFYFFLAGFLLFDYLIRIPATNPREFRSHSFSNKKKKPVNHKHTKKRRKTMKKNNVRNLLVAGALCVTCFAGGTFAYLTDAERTTNKFQVGKVDIQLTEPHWEETLNQTLVPTQIIPKDPTVTNVGVNDAFVYLEVKVPMANVITTDSAGVRQSDGTAVNQQLFTFQANPGWTLLKSEEVNGNMVHTYAYNKILAKSDVSVPLFNNVTFANVVEGQIDSNKYDIPVAAFAIQTEHTGGTSTDIPTQAKEAYEKYVNQNLGQTGAVYTK